jgi:putative membrane protein
MVGEFAAMNHSLIWLTIPFSVLISWIYITMETVGDSSEDPFENFINDVPMTALCKTIEIDLREMLDETDLPDGIKPVDDVLW